MTTPHPRAPKDEVAARQGTKQRMNVRVLVTSLILIAIIFAGLYFMFLDAPHSENTGTSPQRSGQEQTGPSPAPPVIPPAPQ